MRKEHRKGNLLKKGVDSGYTVCRHALTECQVEIRKGLIVHLMVRAAEEDAQVAATEAGP